MRLFKWCKWQPSLLAEEAAYCFRQAEVTRIELNNYGISKIAVRFRSGEAETSWYPEGSTIRTLSLCGNAAILSGRDARFVVNAAKERAKQIQQEDIDRFERDKVIALEPVVHRLSKVKR